MATNFPTSVDVLTNPVSNDSLNSPSHSAQHANANDAIEAIEGYLLTGAGNAGLVKLIPSGATNGTVAANGDVTIGSAVASVTVTGAFSAAYENYKIIVTGGVGSTAAATAMTIGAAATGYYGSYLSVTISTNAFSSATDNNAARFTYAGTTTTNGQSINVEVGSPFLAKNTSMTTSFAGLVAAGGAGVYSGFLNNTTSYTDFTFTPTSGTLTGGTIRIYGYK